MISDEELAKVRTETCGLAYDGYEDWAATIECLVNEVRRLRDELQIEKSTNDYLDDAKEKIAVMNCDLKNNADDLKDEIQRLREENAQLKHDAETVMNDYQDLSRLCATDSPLIALGKAVNELELWAATRKWVEANFMLGSKSHVEARRLIALGKAVEAMPTGQALVNDEIHGWSLIKDERGSVRQPAKSSALEALLAAEVPK